MYDRLLDHLLLIDGHWAPYAAGSRLVQIVFARQLNKDIYVRMGESVFSLGLSGGTVIKGIQTGARQAEILHCGELLQPLPSARLVPPSAQPKGDKMLASHSMPIKLFGPTYICASLRREGRVER